MTNMRFAVIKDGIVHNVIIAQDGFEVDGFTLVASDDAKIGQTYGDGVFSDAPSTVAPLTTDEVAAEAQARLDAFARSRNYDSILSACTYANSTNPTFAAEGAYCVQLRDQTWAKLYEMLAEVQAGTRAIPTSFDDIAPELPVSSAAWPE